MEQHAPAEPASPNPSNPIEPQRRRRRRRGFLAGLVLGAVGAGLLGFAVGATMPVAEAALGAFAHRGAGHDGAPSPERLTEHAEFFVDFALHRLEATDQQKDSVQDIVKEAIDELVPVVEQHRENRDELRRLLTGETIDRAAIEKLRTEEIALADTLSRTLAEALADSAEELTPAQRTELAEQVARFHHRH